MAEPKTRQKTNVAEQRNAAAADPGHFFISLLTLASFDETRPEPRLRKPGRRRLRESQRGIARNGGLEVAKNIGKENLSENSPYFSNLKTCCWLTNTHTFFKYTILRVT